MDAADFILYYTTSVLLVNWVVMLTKVGDWLVKDLGFKDELGIRVMCVFFWPVVLPTLFALKSYHNTFFKEKK